MKKNQIKRNIFITSVIYIVLGSILITNIINTSLQIYNKNKQKKEFAEKIEVLKDKEDELKGTVTKLQDPDYVARYAREKYLYSKDGEIIIRIPE